MNSRRVVLDTDVASLSIKHTLPPWLLAELLGAQVAISFVTLGELTRWATLSARACLSIAMSERGDTRAVQGSSESMSRSGHARVPDPQRAEVFDAALQRSLQVGVLAVHLRDGP